MARNKSGKRKEPITTLHDVQREKAKAQERLAYTQSLIEEDWDTLQDQFRPSAWLSMADRYIPFLGNVLPLGRVISSVFGNLRKSQSADNSKDDEEEKAEESNDQKGEHWVGSLSKWLLPFLTGAVAMSAIWSRRKGR